MAEVRSCTGLYLRPAGLTNNNQQYSSTPGLNYKCPVAGRWGLGEGATQFSIFRLYRSRRASEGRGRGEDGGDASWGVGTLKEGLELFKPLPPLLAVACRRGTTAYWCGEGHATSLRAFAGTGGPEPHCPFMTPPLFFTARGRDLTLTLKRTGERSPFCFLFSLT